MNLIDLILDFIHCKVCRNFNIFDLNETMKISGNEIVKFIQPQRAYEFQLNHHENIGIKHFKNNFAQLQKREFLPIITLNAYFLKQ